MPKIPTRCGPGDIVKAAFGKPKERRKAVAMGCGCSMSQTDLKALPKPDLVWDAGKPASKRRKGLEKTAVKRGCRQVLWNLSLTHHTAADVKARAAARADALWLQRRNICKK